jgi:hypothetical protein
MYIYCMCISTIFFTYIRVSGIVWRISAIKSAECILYLQYLTYIRIVLLQYVGRVSPRDVCQYWPHTLYIQYMYNTLCFSIFPQCINMERTYSVNHYFHRLNMELELQNTFGLHVT